MALLTKSNSAPATQSQASSGGLHKDVNCANLYYDSHRCKLIWLPFLSSNLLLLGPSLLVGLLMDVHDFKLVSHTRPTTRASRHGHLDGPHP